MDDRERLALLLRVARWYYVDDLSQEEISARLGQSRSSVSRLLKQARDRRVVRFQVSHPLERALALEQALVTRYGIREARVCIPNPDQSSLDVVAEGAAEVMVDLTQDATVVSISNGRSVAAVVAAMPKVHRPDCCVVQMIGVLGKDSRLTDSPEVTRGLANVLDCDYRLMPAPLVVTDQRLAAALRHESQVATALALASHADVALTGIGAFDGTTSGSIFDSWQTPEMVRDLAARGAVGHVCGHHFTGSGEHVENDVCRRIMAVPLNQLTGIRTVVGVAYGPEKVDAIRGALEGHHMDVLVTDGQTAASLLPD